MTNAVFTCLIQESEIERLNAQLAELVSHRSEYERCCDELEIQTKEEQNRLAMVQTSLKSVQQQIEKVRHTTMYCYIGSDNCVGQCSCMTKFG